MLILILGIILFLGTHTFTTLRDRRARLVEGLGANTFKLLYSAVALLGFALIVWGFSLYRAEGMIPLWTPPAWGRTAAIVLMWFSFVALACSGKAPGRIRGWLRHPMLVGVKFWALAHLLANEALAACCCSVPSSHGRCMTGLPSSGGATRGRRGCRRSRGPTASRSVPGPLPMSR